MRKRWASRRILSDDEILFAKNFSPPGTRAQLHVMFVSRAIACEKRRPCLVELRHLQYYQNFAFQEFSIDDPFASDPAALDLYLAKVGL